MVYRVNKAISRWPSTRTTVTNLLRSGPLSVRGHLVALAQIECGYRAFGLSLARDPARGERPGAMPGADRAAPTIFPCPRPLDYHDLACFTYLFTYPGGAGAARPGSGSIPASLAPEPRGNTTSPGTTPVSTTANSQLSVPNSSHKSAPPPAAAIRDYKPHQPSP